MTNNQSKTDRDDDDVVTWDCIRGISFERAKRLLRPWLSGIYASQQDDFNCWQALIGTDMGGDAPGAPALPRVGLLRLLLLQASVPDA